MKCNKCGAQNNKDSKFCAECGLKLEIKKTLKTKVVQNNLNKTVVSIDKKDSSKKVSSKKDSSDKKTSDGKINLKELLNKEKHNKNFFNIGYVFANRYELKEFLGRGGMGEIYKAYDKFKDIFIVLKILLPSLTGQKDIVQRFLNEAKIAKEIVHKNIVRAIDVSDFEGVKYIVMEYVEGETLREWIDEKSGKSDVEDILDIVIQLCKGVGYAHGFTIHRDLKPENIMLNKDSVVKIMDFGIAKTLSINQVTETVSSIGTAYYMAPEQTRNAGKVDERADLFSIGVIFYEMITGKVPIGNFRTPTSTRKMITKGIGEILRIALEPDAKDRFQSAQELEKDLEAELSIIKKIKLEQKVFNEVDVKTKPYKQKKIGSLEKKKVKPEFVVRQGFSLSKLNLILIVSLSVVAGAFVFVLSKGFFEKKHVENFVETSDYLGIKTNKTKRPAKQKIRIKVPSDLIIVSDNFNRETDLPYQVKSRKSKIQMALIPRSDYFIGSDMGAGDRDEEPMHKVWVDSFYMGIYEITNRQYKMFIEDTDYIAPINVLGKDSAYTIWKQNDIAKELLDYPVINISWYDANEFCKWLCEKENVPQGTYRLPTEAEWEKASKAGQDYMYPWGNETPSAEFLNYNQKWNGVFTLKKVGSYESNLYGIYDIAGNVWEWCIDRYDTDFYKTAEYKNPVNIEKGSQRVLRGGSWSSYAFLVRSANRYSNDPDVRYFYNGFRIVRVIR
jgi:formylglycine-generating enzyme required for sulfatase activity/tRNA A-37 threonylcarbamoyl transferase component Bud32